MQFPNPITATVRRPGQPDAYGDVTTGTTDHTITGAFAPTSSADVIDAARDGIEVDAAFYAAITVDVSPGDLIEIDGTVYRLVGTPQRWRSPFTTALHGTRLLLTRGQG